MPITRQQYSRALTLANNTHGELTYLRKLIILQCYVITTGLENPELDRKSIEDALQKMLQGAVPTNIDDAEELAFIRVELRAQNLTASQSIRHQRWRDKKAKNKHCEKP